MKEGFISALGTPLDKNGQLAVDSYRKQINDQINAGAVGVLCMGSMGQQAFLSQKICAKVAEEAVRAAEGRAAVFVGAMDCSVTRAKERTKAMEHLDIDGFVLTTPYYSPCSRDQIVNYFKRVSCFTEKPILLYDLPVVTQSKITFDIVLELMRDIPNLAGIKSPDLAMLRRLKLESGLKKDFIMAYSGLDTFDIAFKWGIGNCLDGMLTCTPKNSRQLFEAMSEGDYAAAGRYLNNIIALRDCFVANDLWPSYTAAMNFLGYDGDFGPDYVSRASDKAIMAVRKEMIRIGEL